MLTKLKDHQLVWKHLDWAMNKNEVKAVEIFTRRSADELTSERMRIDLILDYLKNYKTAMIIYLEYLVFQKNIKACFDRPFYLKKGTFPNFFLILEREVQHRVDVHIPGERDHAHQS